MNSSRGVPRRPARELMEFDVRTVQQAAWAGFDAFVTADQNLRVQQNLLGIPIAVIVLVARSNVLEDLLPLVSGVRDALSRTRPGELTLVGPF